MQIGRSRVLALLAVVSIVGAACSSTSATPTVAPGTQAPATQAPATSAPSPTAAPVTSYPRAQTLYTQGTAWGAPSTWNPFDPNHAMGVIGLQYETLFLYDPLKDTYTNWLATGGSWDSTNTTYTINVRQGVKWSDGTALTASDVAFTIGLYKLQALGSDLWTYVTGVTAPDASTVVVTFKNPAYQEWQNFLYNTPIVPQAIWTQYNNENILKFTNDNGVGTGPYTNLTHAADRQVWQKNPNWWATSALSLNVAPTYVVDLVNTSNSAALGNLLAGNVDLSNNYLPGVATLVNGGYSITTYYPNPPYMLPGNTAVLIPNDQKAPMSDPAFRKALATAINVNDIVNTDYGQIVAASDPTGLLPYFSKYIDKTVTAKLGFSFSTSKAKAMLAAAGYKTDSSGNVLNKDGSAMKLVLEVPDGWSDWMEAENLIAASAKLAGINIDPEHPAQATTITDRNRTDATTVPKFDLEINNDVQVSNTPFQWFDYVFREPLPFGAGETRNYEGYKNDAAWALVQQLDTTPVSDTAKMQSICSQLETIQLTDMPVIPLWYNGVWSQANNTVWTNWPSSTGSNNEMAVAWGGYWQMGAIFMLTNLKPVPPAS